VLAILVVSRTSLKNRIFTAISFALLSATPLALWLIRNQFLTGTFMGERAPSQYSLYHNVYRTRNTLLGWFLPERFEPYYSELSLIAAVPAILIALYIVRNKRYVNNHLPVLFLLTVFCVVYSGFLIVSSTTTAYDQIGTRLLAPIYPFLVLIALFVLLMLLKSISQPKIQHSAQYFAAGVIAVSAMIPIYRTFRYIETGAENGYGYATKAWKSSSTLAELERTPACKDSVIYSNRSDVLYIFAGITGYSTPRKTFYNSEQLADSLDHIRWPDTSPACLVWFENTRDYLFTPEELSSIANVSLLVKADDGEIYLVSTPSNE